MTPRELIGEIKMDLESDPWGHAMGTWFEIAAELWWRGEVPAHWCYSPGIAEDPRDHDSLLFGELEGMDTTDLVHVGNLLERYTELLKRHGMDY